MKDTIDLYCKCQAADVSEDTQTENINEGKTSGRPAPKRK